MVSPKHVRAAFQRIIAQAVPPVLLFARADWGAFLQEMGASVPVLADYVGGDAAPSGGGLASAFAGLSPGKVQTKLTGLVRKLPACWVRRSRGTGVLPCLPSVT